MARIKFTKALNSFFPGITDTNIEGANVREIMDGLEKTYPGIKGYLLEEDGQLRKHVNIFLKDEMVLDREGLSDKVEKEDEILIFQALSGG